MCRLFECWKGDQMKGIVITKMIIITGIILAAIYFLTQQGNLQNAGAPTTKTAAIKSPEQASNQIAQIGSGVDNVGSILEDIDKRLG